MFGRSGKER